jgi:hypothetical protein
MTSATVSELHARKASGAPNARLRGALVTMALLGGLGGAAAQEIGGGTKGPVTGAAGGATAEGANSNIERCAEALGTIAVVEDQAAGWYRTLQTYKLGSTVPVLRMMIQQSNCFVVVERGAAMRNMAMERQLQQSGEMREGSNFGGGQMVAADYTMSPSIQFSQNTGGGGGALGGLSRTLGSIGAIAGAFKTNEASTTLLMIDNRSGVQLAAAEGTAKNTDFAGFASAYSWIAGAGGGGGGYSNTPEGRIIVAAFSDSYNQLVKVVRNYKAQTVKGGLGTGGALGVQGSSTPAAPK